MSEGAVGFLVLTTISVVVAAVGHALSTRLIPTSFISGVLSIVLFLAIVIARGDSDPLIAIAAVVGAGFSTTIAAVVGMVFTHVRSRRGALP